MLSKQHRHVLLVKEKRVRAGPLQDVEEVVSVATETAVVVSVATVVAVASGGDRRRLEKKKAKLRIKWVKSAICYLKEQRGTIRALGVRKIQQTGEQEDHPPLRGMIRKENQL